MKFFSSLDAHPPIQSVFYRIEYVYKTQVASVETKHTQHSTPNTNNKIGIHYTTSTNKTKRQNAYTRSAI